MSLDPQARMIKVMEENTPSMRYQGEPFEKWQREARNKLIQLLGFPFERTEPKYSVKPLSSDGYREYEITFFSEPEVEVICNLRIPTGVKQPIPLVICLQGHSTGMHISLGLPIYPKDAESINGGDRDFARQIIARGQASLAIEQRGFGTRGGTPEGPACQQPAVQAMLMGKTLLGQRVWDISCAIDVVTEAFPELDRTRIAVMGNSGGGTTALYAAAVDTRIAAVMPSCAFCAFLPSIGKQRHCICNYVPGIMPYFDMGDIAAIIAPRPLIIVNGYKDIIFPIEGAKEQFLVAQNAYKAANAADLIRHVIGPEGHRFYAMQGWQAFDELTHWKE